MSGLFWYSSHHDGGVQGSEFGEPNGIMHELFVLTGEGNVIVRVGIHDPRVMVDLLLPLEQLDFVIEALVNARDSVHGSSNR